MDGKGIPVTVSRLQAIYHELIAQGAHNINLVTPTPYTRAILESLSEPLPVPVVYNCGGYERVETIRAFEGKVQIYLPDLKYMDSAMAERYSGARDYPDIAARAILAMYEQTGPYVLDDDGMLQKGVVIRHLILPGHVDNTKRVIDWVRDHFEPEQVLFSLMRQYIPCGRASEYPEIDRPLTDEEYDEAEQYLFDSGIEDGFVQEKSSASEGFIPAFDGTGI
jgi:putative pyruvate formate lyase activating enzyme